MFQGLAMESDYNPGALRKVLAIVRASVLP